MFIFLVIFKGIFVRWRDVCLESFFMKKAAFKKKRQCVDVNVFFVLVAL